MVCRNSQSVCQIKQLCFIIFSVIFYSAISGDLLANNYLSLLQEGSTLRYEHWNIERKEVTGYSIFLQIYLDEKKQWLEKNANTKPDGNVAKSAVNINGKARKIFCCIASVGGGFSFCCI